MKIVLGNVDYRMHMTNEGDQFQRGLESAGWTLVGPGFAEDCRGCRNVPAILARFRPTHVVVHDKRDWDPASPISFRKDVGYENIAALAGYDGGRKYAVVKDAATFDDYQERFCGEVGADAVVTYYHADCVDEHSPWLARYRKVRTYHSVDPDEVRSVDVRGPRRRCIVTGAVSGSYPLRALVVKNRTLLEVDRMKHPGYGNRGSKTQEYLRVLSRYKVHIATASRFGFALRKIVESVAVGCTVVTDLPARDVLPEIDGALVRVDPGISVTRLRSVVDAAEAEWNLDERLAWAAQAVERYDYRAIGARLSVDLSEGT